MTPRKRLPNRRFAESFELEVEGGSRRRRRAFDRTSARGWSGNDPASALPRQPRSPERCIRCRSRRHHGGRRPMSDISNNSEELQAYLLAEFRCAALCNKLATAESLTLGEVAR
jgi:hypothetical protein